MAGADQLRGIDEWREDSCTPTEGRVRVEGASGRCEGNTRGRCQGKVRGEKVRGEGARGRCEGKVRGKGARERCETKVRVEGARRVRVAQKCPSANTHTREAAHLDGERDMRLCIAARAKGS